MKADPKTEKEVLAMIDDLWDAYSSLDLERVLSHYSREAGVIHIGTGSDEERIGFEALKGGLERDFNQAQSLSMRRQWASVSAAGDVAWVAAECEVVAKTTKGEKIEIITRFTGILVKEDDKWLIFQSHVSLPAAEQKRGKSYPTEWYAMMPLR